MPSELRFVSCQMWRFSMPGEKTTLLLLPYRRVCWQAIKTSPLGAPIKPLAEPWILLSKYYHSIANATVVICLFFLFILVSLYQSREFLFLFFCCCFRVTHSFFYTSSLRKRLSWLMLASRSYRRILCFIALSDLLTRLLKDTPRRP